ncbi:MAG TPA: DUF1800 family protein [Rudaea sp.]|nr:DUF1800 family protein [Rudaea sp.]
MSPTTAATAAANSRRRALTTLASALGVDLSPQPAAMRRVDKVPVDTRLAHLDSRSAPALTLSGPPSPVAWLNRATFGCTQSDLVAFTALGATDEARWTAWVTQQLDPASVGDTACDTRIASANFQSLNFTPSQLWSTFHADTANYSHRMLPIAEVECATIIRQTCSQRQLFETMVDFWHDHFSVFGWDYDGGPMFPAFDAIFRSLATGSGVFGNFKSLLIAVCESASMMYMLDLYSSVAAGPNENYARELCELHTLGAMNYAGVVDPDPNTGVYDIPTGTAADGNPIRLKYVDDDVYNATSALTGWTLSQSTWDTRNDANPGNFEYVDSLHYNKVTTTFLNRYIGANTHQGAGFDIFNWLSIHPGVATFIATKMCRRLVGDNPPASLVTNVANVFLTNYQAPNQLQLTTQAILTSAEFLAGWGQKMKRPGGAMVGALRALGADFTPVPDLDNPNPAYQTNTWTTTDALIYALQSAGHRPFYWPAPNGYPDVQTAWASTGTLGMTLRMLAQIVETTQDRNVGGSPFIADVLGQTLAAIPLAADRTAANIAGLWCDRILGYRPANVYNAAVDFMRQDAQPTDSLDTALASDTWTGAGKLSLHYAQSRLRSMVALILCSPDFLTR